jgi:hypothetical protein
MDVLLLMLDTCLMLVLFRWAIINDAAGTRGTSSGFFAYRNEQAPPPDRSARQAARRDRRR